MAHALCPVCVAYAQHAHAHAHGMHMVCTWPCTAHACLREDLLARLDGRVRAQLAERTDGSHVEARVTNEGHAHLVSKYGNRR